jgi:glycosyltransferase involved in cell wall biosynthesis
VTRHVLGGLQALGWECHCLALNYFGDPHRETFACYPASLGGDLHGMRRYRELVRRLQPDACLVLHDPWIVAAYLEHKGDEPLLAYMPVDGRNVATAAALNALTLAVFYTQFGLAEARQGGYTGPATVIPHGVDAGLFHPMDRADCWRRVGVPVLEDDAFVVGNVNRNQPRKRLDLSLSAFARWVAEERPDRPAYLWLHCAAKDRGWDLEQLATYYGVGPRLIVTNRDMTSFWGLKVADMPLVYNAFHVQLNTSTGEGWGLTTFEGMACGVPQIVGDWAALGEWAKGAAYLVPCTATTATVEQVNVIGGVPDEAGLVQAIQHLYSDEALRAELGQWGRALAQQPRFHWAAIAAQFDRALRAAVAGDLDAYQAPREG